MDIKSTGTPLKTGRRAELWNPELDDTLVCIGVHQETHDVKTFTFASVDNRSFVFDAGQYFLFDFEIDDAVESRCYSISSSPRRANAFSVTVKRVAGGKVSNWLHDNLAAGAKVKANGPLGRFVRTDRPGNRFLLLSGGSGITPMMSMLRDMADTCEDADVVFLHAARTPRDLIFRGELAGLAEKIKGLRLHFLPEDRTGEPSWPGLSGRISADYLRLAVPDIAGRIVMCCGPAPFMAAARSIVGELGVPASNYVEESFDAAVIDDTVEAPAEPAGAKTFAVAFSKQGRTIDVPEEQTVLSCARKAGIRIPSSCANGICGTCKSKLLSGSVDMQHNGGIRQREIDAGLFLPCCSRPLSDLVIER